MNSLSPIGLITCFIFSMVLNGSSISVHAPSDPRQQEAYIINNSKDTIYFKPESRAANPGLDPYGAYVLAPGEVYNLPFDAVVTSRTATGKIFRVPTGSKIVVNVNGIPEPANIIAKASLLLPTYGNVESPCVQFAKLANPKQVLFCKPDFIAVDK